MLQVRSAHERGTADHGWLRTAHSFSFADYHDPRWMGYRGLRVINDDHVAPGSGFGMHPHRDMEIVTYIVDGALQHRDSLGNGAVITPGELQVITAGSGIQHSEFNPSKEAPVHLFQIWLVPERRGLTPSYAQKKFPLAEKRGELRLLAGRGESEALPINADAKVYGAHLGAGQRVEHRPDAGRFTWLQIARGTVAVTSEGETHTVSAGDAVYADQPGGAPWHMTAENDAEVLLFDLA